MDLTLSDVRRFRSFADTTMKKRTALTSDLLSGPQLHSRYTKRAQACTLDNVAQRKPRRFNVTLDAERAAKLAQLAQRTSINEGSLARSLLSQALDEAGADPRNVVALLDGIPGAFRRAQLGLRQARMGRTIDLDEL